ncbi:hypothetical protein BDP27DRAFT_65382 [Rhodocollybia butyracea]|uniref:Uncharacterized protein n=1 Tax=Rhodocollybia butyracea TaxID=206335 RepID=A0A9P5U441_9AGAR|nr:hypothetical protein BDP27DRAFT_65382 [Rhodocollybia butyracea]
MSVSHWQPKRDFAQVEELLCAPGNLHEIETRVINGLVQRVYKNLPPSIRMFWLGAVQLHRDKTYVVFENQRFTFGEANERVAKAASVFRDIYGVKKGDRVAICSRNYPDFLITFWACHLIGAVSVLVNAWLPAEPLKHCLIKTQCTLIIVDPERADIVVSFVPELKSNGVAVLESPQGSWPGMDNWGSVLKNYTGDCTKILKEDPKVTPEDNATIVFTSGTSGLPKGVLSTQRAFLSTLPNALVGRSRAVLRRGDSLANAGPPPGPQPGILLPTPLFHVTGISFILGGAIMGFKLVLMRKWNVDEASRLVREENIGLTGGVPSAIADLADSPTASGAPIQGIMYGGSAVSAALATRAKKAFPTATITQAYGLTESNATTVGFGGEDYEARLDSCGRALPVSDIMIVTDDKACPTGTAGEIWLRGPNIMKGYWDDPVATSQALTHDGWLKTGDVGYLDNEGFLYVKDRLKDIIIRGGENVDSVAVENVFYENEGVLEAAAVGVPDEKLGELVTAIVTVKPAFRGKVSSDALLELARKRLPKFAVPVMILVRDEDFVHTPSGKIIKTELRKVAAEAWNKQRSPKAKL